MLAIWLFYSLYRQVTDQPDLDRSLSLIYEVPFGVDAWKFWLAILLVFVNWGIEARKWQLLVTSIQPMRFFTAFKSVLCGVTLSLNTPNRIGEYAGRVLFVQDGQRLRSVSLSVVGSMAQLIITMVMGCLGLAWLMLTKRAVNGLMGLTPFWLNVFLYVSILVTMIFTLLFFRLKGMVRLLMRLPYGDRLATYIRVVETVDAKILLRLLHLSLWRYIVFVLQYVLMLQVLQVESRYWPAYWLVAVMFWILAVIPSIALAELGIRGTIANALFAYSGNTVGILAVTFGIWFANLFIPALAGSLLILSIKTKKER